MIYIKKRKATSRESKGLGDYFVELLEKGIVEEDGYDIKKLKKMFKRLWLIWARTVDHRIGKTDDDK